jgi:hypothetical protein
LGVKQHQPEAAIRTVKTGHRFHRTPAAFAILMIAAAVIGGCQPATTPAPTPEPATQPPRIVRIVVTLTPLPTETPPPTPTLPYNVADASGAWNVNVIFTLRGHQTFREVRFVGTAILNVDLAGRVTGSAEFYPAIGPLPCVSAILDAEPLRAQISGSLRPATSATGIPEVSNNEPILDLTFHPADPLERTALRLQCPGFTEVYDVAEPMLWPVLNATGQMTISVLLRGGYRQTRTDDLTGPTGGGIRGVLVSEIDVSR